MQLGKKNFTVVRLNGIIRTSFLQSSSLLKCQLSSHYSYSSHYSRLQTPASRDRRHAAILTPSPEVENDYYHLFLPVILVTTFVRFSRLAIDFSSIFIIILWIGFIWGEFLRWFQYAKSSLSIRLTQTDMTLDFKSILTRVSITVLIIHYVVHIDLFFLNLPGNGDYETLFPSNQSLDGISSSLSFSSKKTSVSYLCHTQHSCNLDR